MKYFYDENNIRYTFIAGKEGININWLFLPAGPGLDSSYFVNLIEVLSLPGNIWLLDFPGNGTNYLHEQNFDEWLSIFVPMLKSFPNPVIVGHSFGSMLPMLFKECEELLKGFVVLNSSPCLWLEAAGQYAKEHQLPDLSLEMQDFTQQPSQETFNKALNACMPYYFPLTTLEIGRNLFKKIPFAFEPAVWWQRKAIEISYKANWIPETVQTLIIGSEFDAITPFSLFKNDKQFERPNIKQVCIKGGGHLPWIENPNDVKSAFEKFLTQLQEH